MIITGDGNLLRVHTDDGNDKLFTFQGTGRRYPSSFGGTYQIIGGDGSCSSQYRTVFLFHHSVEATQRRY